MIVNLPEEGKYCLLDHIKTFEQSTLLNDWKKVANIISILKNGKYIIANFLLQAHQPYQHVCKLTERILLQRLNWLLEKDNTTIRSQLEFRTNRSTVDQIKIQQAVADIQHQGQRLKKQKIFSSFSTSLKSGEKVFFSNWHTNLSKCLDERVP